MKEIKNISILVFSLFAGITVYAQKLPEQKPVSVVASAGVSREAKDDEKREELSKKLMERKQELRREEHEKAKERKAAIREERKEKAK
jgi:hypothetical protein